MGHRQQRNNWLYIYNMSDKFCDILCRMDNADMQCNERNMRDNNLKW